MTSNSSGVPPGGAAAGTGGSKRLAQQQAQVDEVVDIMRQNVDKVLERDKNLSLLDDRADKLQHNAAQFEQQAGKLKRKFWWKNMKMMIVMGIVGTIFAIVVIAWIASKVKSVAPVLPSGGATTSIPSAENEPVIPAGAMGVPEGNKVTSSSRGKSSNRKTKTKTTKTPNVGPGSSTIPGAAIEAAGANNNNDADDKDDSPVVEEPTKKAIRRAIRAIFNRS